MKTYTKAELFSLLKNGRVRIKTNLENMEIFWPAEAWNENVYAFENTYVKLQLSVYTKGGDTVYRKLCLQCKTDLVLYQIDYESVFPEEMKEFIAYKSFINAPAAAFVRFGEYGFYTGVENPFFEAASVENMGILSYEPSLVLKAGEVYEAEPQFLGCYEQIGEYVREKEPINIESFQTGSRRPRFFNPCGEIALDLGEINAMRRYVTEYYNVIKKSFDHILYFFFYPKKQLPESEEEVQDYLSAIDRFKQISGDIVAFNPHVKTTVPTEEKPYWELAPKDSAAEKILHYAQRKGLRCGYYMGCAFNGEGGNAALLPYRPDKTNWKKVDAFGNVSSENCLGCDEYLDWWYAVQKNTIEKYDLGYWAWDPGPGNGNDCYAIDHGHIPGKGEYKGWRNSQKLLARMKAEFPELFLMSFYGRKEYGIWGFRYFSQHEVYWEQTVLFGATLHNDLHDDRMNAHGTRLQNQWSMDFRFLPAHLGHGLVPRMGESWFDPTMDRAYDLGGWKYALLSAIACCGSATCCTIPDCLENVPGFVSFYQKWIRWAKENYRYCEFTRPVADQVSNGMIDGFARIDRERGQIFLFSSSPKVLRKKLSLDKKIGLDTEKGFFLKVLYCQEKNLENHPVYYQNEYHMGDVLDITLPPYGAVVLELTDKMEQDAEQLAELPRRVHTIDRFTDAEGNTFVYREHEAHESITLSSNAVFSIELKEALEKSHVENEKYLLQKIAQWHEEGMPFTFSSALPHRLVMYLPFDGPDQPEEVRLFLNEIEVPVETFYLHKVPIFRYVFAEKYIKWGNENQIRLQIKRLAANSFLGIHVDYPEGIDGMKAEETVFEEYDQGAELYPDSSLLIDSFEITPRVLSDRDENFEITVRTEVDPDRIEAIYFLHPTQPQMPSLIFDPQRQVWHGNYNTGVRSHNIFCNTKITAWIRAKDGGIGPRAECEAPVSFIPC